jgi:hypothetical protein
VPVRNGAGRHLIRAVADKLDDNGEVRLRVRVERNGIRDVVRVRIVLSDCAVDLPLYPGPFCEVRP